MSKGKQIARRLVKQLRRDLKGIGWGAKKRALEAAGLSRAYLENVKPERIPLGTYFQLLEGVGIEPVAHTRRALTDSEPIQDFIADARNIAAKSGTPPIVRLARKRGAPGVPEDDAGEDLDAIDRIRFRNPAAAARRIERLMPRLSGPASTRKALVTWGSARRALGRVGDATVALAEAARFLDWTRNPPATSFLISSLTVCLRYRKRNGCALRLSRYQMSVLIASGLIEELGSTAVETAYGCLRQGQVGEAERLLKVSECFRVPPRAIATRLQLSISAAKLSGDFTLAESRLEALHSFRSPDRDFQGTSLTSWADVQRGRGDFVSAASMYAEAVSILKPWPALALQAAVHEVAAHVQARKPDGAACRARQLDGFTGACSLLSSRAPGLLGELIAAGHRQEVPLPLVESLIEELEV